MKGEIRMQAKDMLSQKKGKTFYWKIIPKLMLDLFENDSVKVSQVLEVFDLIPEIQLVKLGDFLSFTLQITAV